jgi:hypothetical protein
MTNLSMATELEQVEVFNLYASIWQVSIDGNGAAREIYDNHYSRIHYRDGRKPKLFVGPGYKIVLKTRDNLALFVWRKFIDDCIPKQEGVNCSVFRNEGELLSSFLILEAEKIVRLAWPFERLYTYVDETKVRTGKPKSGKPNPGKCFIKAGWQRVTDENGEWVRSKSGKLILEKLPLVSGVTVTRALESKQDSLFALTKDTQPLTV